MGNAKTVVSQRSVSRRRASASRIVGLWLAPLAVLGLCVFAAAGCSTPPSLPASASRINLVADGRERTIETEAVTVRDLLDEAGIALGELDRVTPPEVSALADLMTVTVVRVQETASVITQTVPFERQVVRDAAVPEGETRLLQTGQSGVLERHYRITIEDQEEVERALVREVLVQPPLDEVRLVGARPQLHNVTITGTLAYLSHQDAWVMRESTFQRRRLTLLGDLDGRAFSLSPDGQLLLFTRTMTEPDHLNELWLIRTTEAAPNAIPLNVNDILWADWAPDGTRIAWSTAEVTDQAPGWRGQNDLWMATVTTRNTLTARRQIIEALPGSGYGWWGTRYVWSPDSETLAFSRPDAVGVVDLREAALTTLFEFPAFRTYSSWTWNPALTWSPEGDFIVAAIHVEDGSDKPEESPVFDLASLHRAGVYSATLATEVGMWTTPRFSPDGARILFGRAIIPYQSATSLYSLQLMDRDGSNQRPIPDAGGGLEIPEWVWSPDGTAIAFIQLGDVRVQNLDTNEVELLTDEGSVTLVRWQ